MSHHHVPQVLGVRVLARASDELRSITHRTTTNSQQEHAIHVQFADLVHSVLQRVEIRIRLDTTELVQFIVLQRLLHLVVHTVTLDAASTIRHVHNTALRDKSRQLSDLALAEHDTSRISEIKIRNTRDVREKK